jgi:acetyl esterase/lipase
MARSGDVAAAVGMHIGCMSTGLATHLIVLPGGGYSEHVPNEAEPVVHWLTGLGARASVFRYPLLVRHPAPLDALRAELRRLRESGVERIGLLGFSAGGHLAGLAALAPGAHASEAVDFAVLGYAITSMETESYRPARLILLGEDATPELRRATSLDALVTSSSPPFFLWHTAEDPYVPPEHTYRLASSLAAHGVPHTTHVFAHGPHSLGLAQGGLDAAAWTTLAAFWISEQSDARPATPPIATETAWN